MHWMANPEAWVALGTLTALEIVLGIDNIVFISILVGRLPEDSRNKARIMGLGMAMGMRILLLLSITWIMKLTAPLFSVFGEAVSGRDLILISGGMFLLVKSTFEIHNALEAREDVSEKPRAVSFFKVLVLIALLDVVFSLDSVITAVGLAKDIPVMIIAIVLAVLVMMISSKPIGDFVEDHPTVKMLALSFLLLIGLSLVAEGLDFHIPKGYIYFAMGFSVGVEILNMKIRKKKREPLKLRSPIKAGLSR